MSMSIMIPKELHNTLNEITMKYQDGSHEHTQIVRFKDQIIEACTNYGYAKHEKLHCKHVGAHPSNRDYLGVHKGRALSRLEVVVVAGASETTFKTNAIAVQDNPSTKEIARYNVQASKDDPEKAQYKEMEVSHGSLGASHTSHSFGMLHDEVPCDIEALSENGRMSKSKLFMKDKALERMVMQSCEWLVIRWEIAALFPMVCIIIQAALNTTTQQAEGESQVQLLSKILHACPNFMTKGQIEFDKVIVQVLKSQPPRVQDVPAMVTFVSNYGGLPSGRFINMQIEWSSQYPSDRVVAGTFFEWLNALHAKFSSKDLPTFFVNACYYVQASRKEGIVENVCRYLQKGDISQIATQKKPFAMQGNDVLLRGSKLVDEVGLPNKAQKTKLMTSLMDKVVDLVFYEKNGGKNKKMLQEEFSLQLNEVAMQFATSIHDAMKNDGQTIDPHFTETMRVTPQTTFDDSSGVPSNVTVYDKDGKVSHAGLNILTNKGFKAGDHVIEKKEKDMVKICRIIEIDSDGHVKLANLSPIDGKLQDGTFTIGLERFMDVYKVATSRLKILEHYPQSDACLNPHLQVEALKGQVSSIMFAMSLDSPKSPEVLVHLSPSRKVIALKDFEVGELQFYPLTKSCQIVFSDAEYTHNDSHIICSIDGIEAKAILHPQTNTKDYTALFWNLVQAAVSTKAQSNMQFEDIAYDFQLPQCSTSTRARQQFRMNLVKVMNYKKIKRFEEVVLYRKQTKKPTATDSEAPKKKSRAAK